MTESLNSAAQIWIPIIITFLTLVAGGGWGKVYLEYQRKKEAKNEQLKNDYLSKIVWPFFHFPK